MSTITTTREPQVTRAATQGLLDHSIGVLHPTEGSIFHPMNGEAPAMSPLDENGKDNVGIYMLETCFLNAVIADSFMHRTCLPCT